MQWTTWIGPILSLVTFLAAAASYVMTSIVKLAMSEMRLEISEGRAKDREEIKTWINGSFMRAKEVEAQFRAMEHRMDEVERG